jgi:hypothetical protein
LANVMSDFKTVVNTGLRHVVFGVRVARSFVVETQRILSKMLKLPVFEVSNVPLGIVACRNLLINCQADVVVGEWAVRTSTWLKYTFLWCRETTIC